MPKVVAPKVVVMLAVTSALLGGCADNPDAKNPDNVESVASSSTYQSKIQPIEQETRQATVFDGQLDAYDAASNIEDITLDQARKQRELIDSLGQ